MSDTHTDLDDATMSTINEDSTGSVADLVEVRGLTKRYGGAVALNDVDWSVRRGEIHGLVGENGAGKSTLCKIIAGATSPDGGTISVEGRAASYASPKDALQDGIALIAQEVSLAPSLGVVENVFLGNESKRLGIVQRRKLLRRYDALNARVRFDIPARMKVRDLRFSDQQKVEILRALARDSALLILDEPTASLGPQEAELLFDALRQLREEGTTIVLISHHLKDVLAVCDRVTVLRDGQIIQTTTAQEETEGSLIRAMLGRPLSALFPEKQVSQTRDRLPALAVQGLTRGTTFTDVSFELRKGEILGLAGLVGAGRSEVARAIIGADPMDSGQVRLDGTLRKISSPRAAVRAGIGMIPESRRDQGLLLGQSVESNLTLPSVGNYALAGLVRNGRARRASREIIQRLDIRGKNLSGPVAQLSGGNQQKVVYGKWLLTNPSVIIADEPTRGVDVGAKRALYDLLAQLADEGAAVLLISSEMDEIIGLSHRVIVMRQGRISGELSGEQITEEAIMTHAFPQVGEVHIPPTDHPSKEPMKEAVK
jgi:ABC-type sugar transport system ATPase subunit